MSDRALHPEMYGVVYVVLYAVVYIVSQQCSLAGARDARPMYTCAFAVAPRQPRLLQILCVARIKGVPAAQSDCPSANTALTLSVLAKGATSQPCINRLVTSGIQQTCPLSLHYTAIHGLSVQYLGGVYTAAPHSWRGKEPLEIKDGIVAFQVMYPPPPVSSEHKSTKLIRSERLVFAGHARSLRAA